MRTPEIVGFDDQYPVVHQKAKFWCFLVTNRKISAEKLSIEKSILRYFVNLSPVSSSRIAEETKLYF